MKWALESFARKGTKGIFKKGESYDCDEAPKMGRWGTFLQRKYFVRNGKLCTHASSIEVQYPISPVFSFDRVNSRRRNVCFAKCEDCYRYSGGLYIDPVTRLGNMAHK